MARAPLNVRGLSVHHKYTRERRLQCTGHYFSRRDLDYGN
jgi:hypothetical protein